MHRFIVSSLIQRSEGRHFTGSYIKASSNMSTGSRRNMTVINVMWHFYCHICGLTGDHPLLFQEVTCYSYSKVHLLRYLNNNKLQLSTGSFWFFFNTYRIVHIDGEASVRLTSYLVVSEYRADRERKTEPIKTQIHRWSIVHNNNSMQHRCSVLKLWFRWNWGRVTEIS